MESSQNLNLEIVSHCWRYSSLLTYQLSSLVLHPPSDLSLTMTVCYSIEDGDTVSLLEFFSKQTIESITWNWQCLAKERLFRRAIGRNQAALATKADWIWFSDCDQVFSCGFLDHLANELRQRKEALVYPAQMRFVSAEYSPVLLERTLAGPAVLGLPECPSCAKYHNRAVGGLQIVRGDVARISGYCRKIARFMKPARRWRRTYEDVVFRRTLRTKGTAIQVPGLVRIEHRAKGRRGQELLPRNQVASRANGGRVESQAGHAIETGVPSFRIEVERLPSFCLGLAAHPARWESTVARMQPYLRNLKIVFGYDAKAVETKACFTSEGMRLKWLGEAGCLLGHVKIWRHLLEDQAPSAVIIEDDVFPHREFQKRIADIEFPIHANLILLGSSWFALPHQRPSRQPFDTLGTANRGSFAYWLPRDTAAKAVSDFEQGRIRGPVDVYLTQQLRAELPAMFVCNPALIVPDVSKSLIWPRRAKDRDKFTTCSGWEFNDYVDALG